MTVAELQKLLNYYPGDTEIRVRDGQNVRRECKVMRVETIPNEEWGKPSHFVLISDKPARY